MYKQHIKRLTVTNVIKKYVVIITNVIKIRFKKTSDSKKINKTTIFQF